MPGRSQGAEGVDDRGQHLEVFVYRIWVNRIAWVAGGQQHNSGDDKCGHAEYMGRMEMCHSGKNFEYRAKRDPVLALWK